MTAACLSYISLCVFFSHLLFVVDFCVLYITYFSQLSSVVCFSPRRNTTRVLLERSGGVRAVPYSDVHKPVALQELHADIHRVHVLVFAAAAECGLEVHVSIMHFPSRLRLLLQLTLVLLLCSFLSLLLSMLLWLSRYHRLYRGMS